MSYESWAFFIFSFICLCFVVVAYEHFLGKKRKDGIRERYINSKPHPLIFRLLYFTVFFVVFPLSFSLLIFNQWVWYQLYGILIIYYFVLLLCYLIYQQRKFRFRMQVYDELSKAVDIFIEQLRIGTDIHGVIKEAYKGTKKPLQLWFQSIHHKIAVGNSLQHAILNSRFIVPRLKYMQYFMMMLMVFDKTGVPIVDELGELKKELFEHEKMVRRMNVAVSLGKYAGLATAVMPFLICFLIYIIAPEYVTPFLKSQFAPLIVAVCSILVFLGIFFVFKLTRFNLKQIDGRICR